MGTYSQEVKAELIDSMAVPRFHYDDNRTNGYLRLVLWLLLNGGFVIVFGWLYRKYGIGYAMNRKELNRSQKVRPKI